MKSDTKEKQKTSQPNAISRLLARSGSARFELGNFIISIMPKTSRLATGAKKTVRSDERLWQKIEKQYRAIRSELSRERYPYLYER